MKTKKKKLMTPDKGLEPLALRLKVWCSTNWANRAHMSNYEYLQYLCYACTFSANKLLLISAPSILVFLSELAVSAPLSLPAKSIKENLPKSLPEDLKEESK